MRERSSIVQAELPHLDCDVLVVGSGVSGLCAAISAREQGAEVILIEKAAIEERGGNT
ncbi:MAG: FAD-binding protein, partial [Chloroflexi bacterium]|nr:FAD-binding protein [Chloroflexota bacterium]